VLTPCLLRLCPGVASPAALSGAGPLSAAPPLALPPGTDPSRPLELLLQLLELCLDGPVLSAVVNSVLEGLSASCVSASIDPAASPGSPACAGLRLATALASRPAMRAAWVRHPDMWQASGARWDVGRAGGCGSAGCGSRGSLRG
jgi:hypothetical protein